MRAGRFRQSNYGAIWRVADLSYYEPVFAEDVLAFLVQLPRCRQRQIGQLARRLGRRPFARSDYTSRDEKGREIEHLLIGDFVFSYWLDHGCREVRVLEIEDAS